MNTFLVSGSDKSKPYLFPNSTISAGGLSKSI